jgi:hypothetical protein
MKIVVRIEVDIDRDAWSLEYGTENTAAAIREDVRAYIQNGTYAHLDQMGMIAEGSEAQYV